LKFINRPQHKTSWSLSVVVLASMNGLGPVMRVRTSDGVESRASRCRDARRTLWMMPSQQIMYDRWIRRRSCKQGETATSAIRWRKTHIKNKPLLYCKIIYIYCCGQTLIGWLQTNRNTKGHEGTVRPTKLSKLDLRPW